MGSPTHSSRRRFLAVAAGGSVAALAGCLSDGRDAGEQAPGQPLDVPTRGEADAPVVVEAYEDIGCPACADFHDSVFPQIEADYIDDGTVRFEFHDLVLPADGSTSWEAASAARAVQDRGGEAVFWTYLGSLFENQEDLDLDTFETLAADLDVDETEVRDAADEQVYDETVSHYTEEAEDQGLDSTPSVIVDGEEIDWESISYDPVADAIERARPEE